MRRWIAMGLAAAMSACCLLTACSNPGNPAGPGDTAGPENPAGPEERPLYVFTGGQLAGSWEEGRWISAVPLEEAELEGFVPAGDGADRSFTLGEILGEAGYYVYSQRDEPDQLLGESYMMQCELYTYSQGLGGFLDEEGDTAALLDPYAAFVPEDPWARRVFALPLSLSGQAAALLTPNYSFSFQFGGISPDLAVSQRLAVSDEVWWSEGEEVLPERWAMAEEALSSRGLTGPYTLQAGELDSGELVLVINNDDAAPGYWDCGSAGGPAGGKYFNLVLYRRTDGTMETVYERVTDYAGDVTNTACIRPLGVWDINGDGQAEICLDDGRWEWGYCYVMAREESGVWQRVLQANFGL